MLFLRAVAVFSLESAQTQFNFKVPSVLFSCAEVKNYVKFESKMTQKYKNIKDIRVNYGKCLFLGGRREENCNRNIIKNDFEAMLLSSGKLPKKLSQKCIWNKIVEKCSFFLTIKLRIKWTLKASLITQAKKYPNFRSKLPKKYQSSLQAFILKKDSIIF